MKSISSLIGKKFKRDVYGPSLWTDTISSVWFRSSWIESGHYKIEVMVTGSKGISYTLSEIRLIRPKGKLDDILERILRQPKLKG